MALPLLMNLLSLLQSCALLLNHQVLEDLVEWRLAVPRSVDFENFENEIEPLLDFEHGFILVQPAVKVIDVEETNAALFIDVRFARSPFFHRSLDDEVDATFVSTMNRFDVETQRLIRGDLPNPKILIVRKVREINGSVNRQEVLADASIDQPELINTMKCHELFELDLVTVGRSDGQTSRSRKNGFLNTVDEVGCHLPTLVTRSRLNVNR